MGGTRERKRLLERGASIKCGAGLVLVIGSQVLVAALPRESGLAASLAFLSLVVALVGMVLWFWGLGQYSLSKGYSAICAALGLFSILGLLILVLLPNRFQIVEEQQGWYPRPTIG